MTAVLAPGVQPFLTLPPIDQMPETIDVWRRSHYQPMALPISQYWPDNQAPTISNVHDHDMRMFHGEAADYDSPFHHDAGPIISPPMGYVPDTNFGSDIDIGTPSTAGFHSDVVDGYHNLRHTSSNTNNIHLHPSHPSARHDRVPSSAHSPQSSLGGLSPHQSYTRLSDIAVKQERPNIVRSITAPAAPEPRRRKCPPPGAPPSCTPSIKRPGSDEDEDEEYIPSEESKPRGRKRQRIPHRAVERRYRENLNAHLDKLRQTVPRTAGGEDLGDGVKPSKCEVLNGAIEHINALGKENAALKTEVNALRSRLEDLERWCNGSSQRAFGK